MTQETMGLDGYPLELVPEPARLTGALYRATGTNAVPGPTIGLIQLRAGPWARVAPARRDKAAPSHRADKNPAEELALLSDADNVRRVGNETMRSHHPLPRHRHPRPDAREPGRTDTLRLKRHEKNLPEERDWPRGSSW